MEFLHQYVGCNVGGHVRLPLCPHLRARLVGIHQLEHEALSACTDTCAILAEASKAAKYRDVVGVYAA